MNTRSLESRDSPSSYRSIVASGHERHFHGPVSFAVDGPGSPAMVGATLVAGVCDLRFAADGVGRSAEPSRTASPTPGRSWGSCSPVANGRAGPIRGMSPPAAGSGVPTCGRSVVNCATRHRSVAGSYWQRDGWVAFAADGTRVELPRTAANEKAFGCAGRDKTGPQLQLTSLYHLGTGLPWTWQIGAGTESEQVHLRHLARRLPADSLLVADAGFTSFELLRSLRERHVHFLVRMGSNRTLLTGLEDVRVRVRGDVVWLWPKDQQTHCPPLRLRLIRIEPANHTPMCLVTSVLDEQALTDRQIARFYRMRWGQEVFHRSFKQTLAQHKMRSDSPAQAARELDWALMGYLILGLWSVEGLLGAGHDPLTWSVSESLRVVRGAMRQGGRLGGGLLARFLRKAVKDSYVRTGSKSARNWPRKKKDHPPGCRRCVRRRRRKNTVP